ncbi:general transcription factor II-I repeat domain-containing protein 2-like isoform X1 [Pelodiscus sinensis]|uniref:general transcription factor II-I repeat domain-containing protein 2-like isoform X1 n=2 Tax=Pelodiscus sinensis TaxID=13735 RepID=UPI003F6B4071
MDSEQSFCRFCIPAYYAKLETEEEDVFCPQCRNKWKTEKFQFSRLPAGMVETIPQLEIKLEDQKEQTMCSVAAEENKRKLFCEGNGEVISVICDETLGHRSDMFMPVEDAAQEYEMVPSGVAYKQPYKETSPPKKRKVDDERRRFQDKWTVDYFVIGCKQSASCLICQHRVSVLKEYNIKRHYTTKHAQLYDKFQGEERERMVLQLKREVVKQQQLFQKVRKESVVLASYAVSEMIAKCGKPFTDGEFIKQCIVKVSEFVCPDRRDVFSNISLSPNAIAERILELSKDIDGQLIEKSTTFCAYSIAVDSTSLIDSPQLAIFVRGVDENFAVTEELLSLATVRGRTTANKIFHCLTEALEQHGLPWHLLAGLTTDGAPVMVDPQNGLVPLVQRKMTEENAEQPVVLHCIIHQQTVCSKSLKFDNVLSVVVKCMNFIRSRGLQRRQLRAFLEEIESKYGDMLYFTEVYWLSRGSALKRFFELKTEVKRFMEEIKVPVPEFEDPRWMTDLAFLVDVTQELNILNLKLQDSDHLVTAVYDNVRAFTTKLKLWKNQISHGNLTHFPTCKSLVEELGPETSFSGPVYANKLDLLLQEFDQRLAGFKMHKESFDMFANPFSVDVETVPCDLQMELIDMQCNSSLKTKFRETEDVIEFFKQLPPSFPNLCKAFRKIMSLFGSTYIYETLFSAMNRLKHRTQLSDAHLAATMKVSTVQSLRPNILRLTELKCFRVSGKR